MDLDGLFHINNPNNPNSPNNLDPHIHLKRRGSQNSENFETTVELQTIYQDEGSENNKNEVRDRSLIDIRLVDKYILTDRRALRQIRSIYTSK